MPSRAKKKSSPAVRFKGRIMTIYDLVYDLVLEKGSVSGSTLRKDFGLDSRTIDHTIEVLEENGLVEAHYPPFGSVVIKLPPEAMEMMEKPGAERKAAKRKGIFPLFTRKGPERMKPADLRRLRKKALALAKEKPRAIPKPKPELKKASKPAKKAAPKPNLDKARAKLAERRNKELEASQGRDENGLAPTIKLGERVKPGALKAKKVKLKDTIVKEREKTPAKKTGGKKMKGSGLLSFLGFGGKKPPAKKAKAPVKAAKKAKKKAKKEKKAGKTAKKAAKKAKTKAGKKAEKK